MADRIKWYYEKLGEKGELKHCPMNDHDGSVTGHIVFGVPAWFDENPEERKRLGWIKHITQDTRDIEYNHQTQYLTHMVVQVDDYTVRDEYSVMDKSPEMLRLEELEGGRGYYFGSESGSILIGGDY